MITLWRRTRIPRRPAILLATVTLVVTTGAMEIALAQQPEAKQTASTPPAATTVDAQALWKAVNELSDDRFQTRQAATEVLWRAGEAARPMLEKAAKSGDPEVASRALTVLHRFRFGLYADVDPVIERWVNQFRFGTTSDKRAVLEQLREAGDIRRLVQLVRAEPNDSIRTDLTNIIAASIRKYAARLPLTGAEEQWDELLGLGAATSEGMRHYAAFLAMTGRGDSKVGVWEQELAKTPGPTLATRLIWLHRSRGDLAAAQQVAHTHGLTTMERELAYELRDWSELERIIKLAAEKSRDPNDVELLGVLAATQKLQGLHEDFTHTMSRIEDIGFTKSGYGFYAAEALMINGDAQTGISVAARPRPDHGFRLLVRQGKMREAFEFIKAGMTKAERDAWFAKQLGASLASESSRDIEFELLIHVLRALQAVGFQEEVLERMDVLAARMLQDKARLSRLSQLSETALRVGRRDLARKYAADAIVGGRASQPLGVLFPNHSQEALIAWRFLEQEASGKSKLERLKTLESIISTTSKLNAEQIADLEKRWRAAPVNGAETNEATWMSAFAEIQHMHGHTDRAIATLQAVKSVTPDLTMRIAELQIEQKAYGDAEKTLNEMLAARPADPPTLYLRGWVRKQLGREQDGDKDITAAKLAPLADSAERRRLAQALERNNLKSEALEEYRRILRFGLFQEWYVNDAAKQIGNSISGRDKRAAAELWERLLFSSFQRERWFTAVEGYLQLTQLVHKTKGRALLEEGRTFEGFQQLLIAYEMMPEDISLAEDVVPELRAAGEDEKADLLYQMVRRANERIIADFPDSAMHLNNLAWLSARCDRDLEEALQLSTRANELQPDNATYTDTLGEVYFRLGRREDAIRCAKRCVELAPTNSFYREQLERFQAKPKDSD